MPMRFWTKKRERQYEHIKAGLQEHGRPKDTAEEIAARTVNKERARAGEAKDQLYAEAQRKHVKGRSSMSKTELEKALSR
jgi:hypothetical protein